MSNQANRSNSLKINKGFTLVEVMVSIVVLSFIVMTATQFMISTSKQNAYIREQGMIKSEVERTLFRISKELNQNRQLIGSASLDYRSRLDMTGAPPVMPDSTLPFIRQTGSLSPEKTCADFPNNFFRANSVGNMLFFVKVSDRFDAVDLSGGGANPENNLHKRQLDIYEFRLYYLSNDSHLDSTSAPSPRLSLINNNLRALRLIEWTSVKYVDRAQLSDYLVDLNSQLGASSANAVRTALMAKGINFAWDKDATALSNAFYAVTGAGTSLASLSTHTIASAQIRNSFLLKSSQNTTYSVAYNKNTTANASSYFPSRMKTPFYYSDTVPSCGGALPATGGPVPLAGGTFPLGFEVVIVGPGSGRAVLFRLSMIGLGAFDNMVEHSHAVVAYARDN